MKQIPVGKYSVHSTFKKFEKDTIFELKAKKKTTLHINFAPFHLSVKGVNPNLKVVHEVISSIGQTIDEAKTLAKDGVDFVLPNGSYTIESTADNITKKTKVVIGGNNPTRDATVNFEDNHEDLIKADYQQNSSSQQNSSDPANPESKSTAEKPQAQTNSEPQRKTSSEEALLKGLVNTMIAIDKASNGELGSNQSSDKSTLANDIQEAQNSMKQIGAILSGVNKIQKKPIMAFKKSVIATLPTIKKIKACYEKSTDLSQAKQCEALEEKAFKQAQEIMQAETGMTANTDSLDKHSKWNEEIKKITIEKTANDIKKMELSIVCIDKGANFSNLNKCINNDGNFK